VDPGREWLARTAVDTLLERIGGGAVPPRTKLADFSIVERESAPRT
jgi:DNA-binding LacI/PurR family transcriptional regulator